mmetsp:Transcript_21355/g.46679  ORF Transcript_21355/g.46679 Transcript_21355/m.46679 type:complete len:110 (+) Transcript_21355:84-413(+)
MVFGLFNKAADKPETKDAQPVDSQPTTSKQQPSLQTTKAGEQKLDAGVDSAASRPSSVFEFGPTVQVGQDILRGVCAGDDPDAIQACTWSIEPAQGKPKDKQHTYRIEF